MPAGVELATAWIRLVPSVDGIQSAVTQEIAGANLDGAGNDAGTKFTGGVKGGMKGLAAVIGGAFVVSAVTGFFADSMGAVREWETLNAQTGAVVKSTGGAANVTAQQVNELANSIEGTTAVQAESIQAGANMLLTFTNLKNEAGEGNDIFNQSVGVLTDMSVAMGTDPQTAAVQLGKALNDPIAGISALSRVGVQFTDDQKGLIESLVASGDTMGAQKIILEELNTQFGGSGAANADTYSGKLALLQDSFGDMGETIVSAVVPALADLFTAITPVFDWLGANQPVLIAVASVLGVILVGAFIAWTASIWAANAALLANPIVLIILAIVALVAAIIFIATQTTFFQDVWNGAMEGIGNAIDWVWQFVIKPVVDFIVGAFNAVIATVELIGKTMGDIFGSIGDIIRGAFNGVVNFVIGIFNTIIDVVNGVIKGINVVADGVKNISGGAIDIRLALLPKIPGLATGGTITSAGTVLVGERGPELLRLPKGASVDPNIAGGTPSELVIVDADRQLIGRMRVEAGGVVSGYDSQAAQARIRGSRGY